MAEADDALRALARSDVPLLVALMHFLAAIPDGGRAERILATALADEGDPAARSRLEAAAALLVRHPGAPDLVRSILGTVDHAAPAAEDAVERFAGLFDRAVALSPEGSVALYALGDAGLLAAATAEVVRWLEERRLVGRDTRVLDLGCGIGRICAALAPRVGAVLGLDISDGMVAAARDRCAGLGNVEIRRSDGRRLAGIGDGSLDLVLAVDSFPYVVLAGEEVTRDLLAEIARVLPSGGHFLALNLSYEDETAQAARAERLAAAGPWCPLERGSRPFTLWDGRAWLFRRT